MVQEKGKTHSGGNPNLQCGQRKSSVLQQTLPGGRGVSAGPSQQWSNGVGLSGRLRTGSWRVLMPSGSSLFLPHLLPLPLWLGSESGQLPLCLEGPGTAEAPVPAAQCQAGWAACFSVQSLYRSKPRWLGRGGGGRGRVKQQWRLLDLVCPPPPISTPPLPSCSLGTPHSQRGGKWRHKMFCTYAPCALWSPPPPRWIQCCFRGNRIGVFAQSLGTACLASKRAALSIGLKRLVRSVCWTQAVHQVGRN